MDYQSNNSQEYSEISSVGTDKSSLSVLAKMMQDQAALVQAMTGDPERNQLATQVMQLQAQLDAAQQEQRELQQEYQQDMHNHGGYEQQFNDSASFRSGRSRSRSRSRSGRRSHRSNHVSSANEEDEFTEYRKSQSIVPDEDVDDVDDELSMSSFHSRGSQLSKGSARSSRSMRSRSVRSAKSRNSAARRTKNGFEAPLQDFKRPENPAGSQTWRSLAFLCTFFIPDSCIRKAGPGAKQAWRYVCNKSVGR